MRHGPNQENFRRNLKETRRGCGLSQVQLAEKAGGSTHYIAIAVDDSIQKALADTCRK
jgi:predicted transcriptional regulator